MKTKKPDNEELRKHFIESLYHTLEGVVSPTPYLEIREGENVDVKFLNGRGRMPMPNTTEVTVLDIDAASLFFDDFNILWESSTGTGKSYTSDALGYAICGSDGYLNLTLSSGLYGTSAIEPFTTPVLENGMPKIKIDPEKCSKYGILFLDEINTGEFNDTRRVVEGVAQINGDIKYLRLPIPGTDRYKKIAIISAMNPSDALHSHAQELSIAGENRFLKFRAPEKTILERGASIIDKDLGDKIHEMFWTQFEKRSGVKGGWREVYPVVTDPEQFPAGLDGATREFIDVALGYVGHDPIETYERNVELMQQAGLQPRFFVRKDNDHDEIIAAQNTLKHGFARRDLRKIRDLGRLVGFIKSIKNGSYTPLVLSLIHI